MVPYFSVIHILYVTLEKRNSLGFPLPQPLSVGCSQKDGHLGQRLSGRILCIHVHFKRLKNFL